MNRYEELIFKSELCEQNARKAQSNWAWQFWQKKADELKEMAYALPLDNLTTFKA